MKVKSLSRVRLLVTPWTVAYQAPPSMRFSSQEYWSGLPFPLQGIFPTQGSNPSLLLFLYLWAAGKSFMYMYPFSPKNSLPSRLPRNRAESPVPSLSGNSQMHRGS